MEPGTQRLTSYRLPRDLTLGGNIKPEKSKKVYIPNVNVQRNKKKEEVTPVKIDTPKPKDRDFGRGRIRENNRRGRGDKGNTIQSDGIWSDGIFKPPTVSRKSGGSSSRTGTEKILERSKLNKSIKKSEEEDKLKNILGDDFTDDGTNTDEWIDPILLPRVEKEEYNDEEIDKKPIILENGEVLNIKGETLSEIKKEVTIHQIIENKTNPYVLMQFPDCWQDMELSKEESKPKGPNDSNSFNENEAKTKIEHCALNSLKSGLLGKVEILKSGKARLCLGEKYFSIDINIQQDFQQELLAAKVNTVSLTGDLVNLGPVNSQLFCSPDLESMLENS
ncbi:DNA-directed RNA polymerase III subunit RPC4 [Nylanderia fulva]|uniref:DNA-directed RNA polymerase III subunit RPC4 n=1 Tax=Nylanderia fulva TaxID=613905 RepID=UPI0010FB49DC|nr:DNA-directed RNA polymerase III subunit RPC4 [Nylanderia fulva]